MNIYQLKLYYKSSALHIFCVNTKKNVHTWISHRQIKYTRIRQLPRSCLIRVYFICKRRLESSLGLNVLSISDRNKNIDTRYRYLNQTLMLTEPRAFFDNFSYYGDIINTEMFIQVYRKTAQLLYYTLNKHSNAIIVALPRSGFLCIPSPQL